MLAYVSLLPFERLYCVYTEVGSDLEGDEVKKKKKVCMHVVGVCVKIGLCHKLKGFRTVVMCFSSVRVWLTATYVISPLESRIYRQAQK